MVAQSRLVSSTPWRPQNLNEVPEVSKQERKVGFQYANGAQYAMNAKNSEILHQMRQKIDEKWYSVNPAMVALCLVGCVAVYFLGRFVGLMQSSGPTM